MLISTSKKRGLLKMLITLILTLVLCTSGLLLIQKPTVVNASGQLSASTQTTSVSEETSYNEQLPVSKATAGSSAVLKGNIEYVSNGHYITCWIRKLASPVTEDNIVSIRITTDSSKITGFTQGVNVKDDTSENDLYYYYKANSGNYDIVIYADVEKIYAPVCCYDLFGDLTNCKSIIFDNFDTSNVTDMSYMFYKCKSLTSLDVSNFNTSNVTDMDSMFDLCSSLTTLNLSSFNTSNVTEMSSVFFGCSSLTSLNVSNFDTSNVTKASQMFGKCSSLTSLDVSSFSFASTTDTMFMFGAGYLDLANQLGLSGEDLENFLNAITDEERVDVLVSMGVDEPTASLYVSICGDGPSKIIAPNDLNGLEISLPGTYEYTDASGNKISTDILVAGKTHTLQKASSDVNETGIVSDSILLSILALCFVFAGFMMLKKKRVR